MSDLNYDDHLVVYADFLGFKDETFDDTPRTEKILRMLATLASLESDFSIEIKTRGSLGAVKIQPAISAFSDHIVISFPLRGMVVVGGPDDNKIPFIVLDQVRRMIAALAFGAFQLGFLVRGAMTIGKLHHAGGVVFGKGLVEAYQLESQVAIYPRVILSNSIISKSVWTQDNQFVEDDFDGMRYLNYFPQMIMMASSGELNWISSVREWYEAARRSIKENIEKLEERMKTKEVAKWSWFSNKFEDANTKLPLSLLRDHGVSGRAIRRLFEGDA
jgi:hypothetical protein